jgi:glucosamine-6-phosphate deaminase
MIMAALESGGEHGGIGTAGTRSAMFGEASVLIAESNAMAGSVAAEVAAACLVRRVRARGAASIILATGNSQLSFLHALAQRADVPWSRVSIFHMDEYVGLPIAHPASFRRFLTDHLVARVNPAAFHGIDGSAPDLAAEMARYSSLLTAETPGLCVMGIGENGHLAFNDPPADFDTQEPIQLVRLAQSSRRQQVGEGHFGTIEDVPEWAITLTIPTLLAPDDVLVVVPERRKAEAVRKALTCPVSPDCPASILQQSKGVTIVLDRDSAALLPNAATAPVCP